MPGWMDAQLIQLQQYRKTDGHIDMYVPGAALEDHQASSGQLRGAGHGLRGGLYEWECTLQSGLSALPHRALSAVPIRV